MTQALPIDTNTAPKAKYWLLVLLSLIIVGTALLLNFMGKQKAEPYLLALMAILSLIGIWALLFYAAGWVSFVTKSKELLVTNTSFNEIPKAIVVTDTDLNIKSANRAFNQLFQQNTTFKSLERVFGEGRENSDAIYRLTQAGKMELFHAEDITCNVQGEKRHIRVTVQANGEKDRTKQSQLTWLFEDKTKDVAENDALFQSVNRTFSFLDEAPAGFFVCNEKGMISFMNGSLAKWMNYDLALFAPNTLHLSKIMPTSMVNLFLEKNNNEATTSFEGSLTLNPNLEKSVVFHRKNVKEQGQQLYYTLLIEKSHNGSESLTPLHVQMKMQQLFEQSPLCLLAVDVNGQILRKNLVVNELQDELGLTNNERVSILTLIDENTRAELAQAIRQSQTSRKSIVVDAPLRGVNKRWGKFYITGQQDGEEAAVITIVETSEQKSLHEQFVQSQKMQAVGQLAGGIAHDFNNVLQAIIGNSDLMLMNMRPSDVGFQEIREIKSNANRAASLVRQLLAFSRQQTFKVQTLQINDVLHDMTALIKRSIADKMKLDIQYGRDLWTTKVDLTQLEQVLLNLAVNARDAMPNGGSLTIRTSNASVEQILALKRPEMPAIEYALIEVQDSGTGIPPEVLAKIFDPFFTTKDLGKGTGLGLSTVYGIVKQSGGFIYVNSIVGKGTTFSIFLPRFIDTTPKETARPVEAIKAPPAPDHTGHGTILLVEDEMAVRAFGTRALTSRGYTVLQAESGIEAIEIFEEEDGKIDLVISDVVMPEMNGPTLLGELRKRNPNIKFIFASGYAEEAFAKDLPEGAEFHFLAKPFQMATLIKTVKEVMAE